ncbi:4-hydroxyphenylacetate 3-hydroxylase family protein [Brevibacillus marinus]|uniref:4-hydroxyphenylacetate 3-hydroxylase family protein n=1 Tax=Brevibacillus marinus TaxID=2496837 RepID=UPI001F49CF18|nr:4-hydroxyphenylacetate 3-hydroxylase N-terminal domain-containing protein [Brevibacillus marinus]
MSRSREEYLSRLRDGRTVWLGNQRVEDVASHPAFRGTVDTVASLLELQDHPDWRETLTFPLPPSGIRAHMAFLVPDRQSDIRRRRRAFEIWANRTLGVMSRLSEYSRSLVTGWYADRYLLGDSVPHFAEKIERYYRESCRADWLSTAAGHDPQVDRSKKSAEWEDADLCVHIVRETQDGIIVRGAKMLATAAPYVDEVIIFPFHRRTQDERRYATMFAVALNTPGVHVVCRENFSSASPENHPLSARFDEMDAVLIFEDALIPWERVFIRDDPEAVWRVRTSPAASALSQHQTVVRLLSKLETVAVVALELADVVGAKGFLHVQEKLGELIIQVETIRGLLDASELAASANQEGIWLPDPRYLTAARNLGTRFYPRALEILQQIGAGGFLQVPADVQAFAGPLGDLLQRYYRGADRGAVERARLFKLAWDLIGSPLGARHELYERFYSGDPVRTYAAQYVNYDHQRLTDDVWRFLQRTKEGMA